MQDKAINAITLKIMQKRQQSASSKENFLYAIDAQSAIFDQFNSCKKKKNYSFQCTKVKLMIILIEHALLRLLFLLKTMEITIHKFTKYHDFLVCNCMSFEMQCHRQLLLLSNGKSRNSSIRCLCRQVNFHLLRINTVI